MPRFRAIVELSPGLSADGPVCNKTRGNKVFVQGVPGCCTNARYAIHGGSYKPKGESGGDQFVAHAGSRIQGVQT